MQRANSTDDKTKTLLLMTFYSKLSSFRLCQKAFCLYMGIYAALAFINLRIKIALTPDWTDGNLIKQHTQLMEFAYRNHEQSRWLQFYLPDYLVQLFHISIPQAYSLRRFLFVFLSFTCFHLYLKRWFDEKTTFAGVLFLAAIMPLSYQDHLQESASLLMLLFLLGLWCIREQRPVLLTIILAIGAFNNETILILPLVYFLYQFREFRLKSSLLLIVKSILIAAPAFIITAFIRYITRDNGGYGKKVWHLPDNWENMLDAFGEHPLDYFTEGYLFIFIIFGLFWIIAYLRYSEMPLFLQRAGWMIPLFVLIHFLTGIIQETRQMVPLAFLIIPMGLFYLFPPNHNKS